MALVLDASPIVAWALREADPRSAGLRERMRSDEALVPALWWFEVRNALLVNERRGRLSQPQTTRFLRRLGRLPITEDRSPDDAVVLALARRHQLTVYDAAYLELSVREGLPLATLDAALVEAARAEGVLLLGE
jgi:predicted nucleic acid-binding protein